MTASADAAKAIQEVNAAPAQKKAMLRAQYEAATSRLSAQGGKPVAVLGPQSYALRPTTQPDMSYWVLGGDPNGTMDGGLQLAENIQFHDLARAYDEDESPHLNNRGIKFNIPLDKASPTYFYGHNGTSHKLAIKDVWDLGFWKTT